MQMLKFHSGIKLRIMASIRFWSVSTKVELGSLAEFQLNM